jgi:NAD(P)H-dependent FMN reductase
LKKISIISSSIRDGRASDRVATYLAGYINAAGQAEASIIDLKAENFPLFEERLKFMKDPAQNVKEFAEKIRSSDGIIIVTPEYNGGYPASLKNVIDLLYEEWRHKPTAIAAVSSGDFAGSQVIEQLVFVLWKIGALMVPARMHVSKVTEAFSAEGQAKGERSAKQAELMLKELLSYMK